jgi:hypothetical protein
LDFLAAWLVDHGWSQKALHRLITTSATYRQSSTYREELATRDPENRLLWRWSVRRLDAEAIRDSMLAVAGSLERTLGGPYIPTQRVDGMVMLDPAHHGSRRRSVYLQHRRTQPLTMLATFDAQPIISNCTRRSSSAVPLQSLALLNSPFVRDCAQQLAWRVLAGGWGGADLEREPIDRAFVLALGRAPTIEERIASQRFLKQQDIVYDGRTDREARVWADFCQMILAANLFLSWE